MYKFENEKDKNDFERILNNAEALKNEHQKNQYIDYEGMLNLNLNYLKEYLNNNVHNHIFVIYQENFDFMIRNNIKIINQKEHQDFIIDYRCRFYEKKEVDNIGSNCK